MSCGSTLSSLAHAPHIRDADIAIDLNVSAKTVRRFLREGHTISQRMFLTMMSALAEHCGAKDQLLPLSTEVECEPEVLFE